MNKSELRQARLHVENLRKAADVLDNLVTDYLEAMITIDFAERGLKNIQAMAMVPVIDTSKIAERAKDTLRLMGGG